MPVSPEVLIAFFLAVSVAITTRYWSQANRFFNEVVVELAKVTWPVRKETVSSSGVVLALVGVAALLLAFLDFVWGTMARQVFSF
ncbi:MAG: preprotein translocase subunit SecE [Deltaproteobacteria bacterium]|nr:preprotein translocase subunit SecE [Deltaproteobacteria bacterium]MBI2500305.1 preprotein translocase subunit SecE [Deltaproteobacteria bacterium]